jgi:hypothetical protein
MLDSRKQHKKRPVITDAAVRESLYSRGFYDSWITPELIVAERKVLEARLKHPPKQSRQLLPGDYD